MTLKEWLGIRAYDINEGDTADIFAQYLAYLDKSGAVYTDPSDIAIEDGELVFTKSAGFDEIYRPVKADGTPSDAVFAAGMMLCHKLSGELPDLANSALLLLGAQGDESISLCSCPSSSADELIRSMTRILPEKRLTALQALDTLAHSCRSKARIDYTEKQTGTVLFSEEISLDDAYTVYTPAAHGTGADRIYPSDGNIRIPYRRKLIGYSCGCVLTEQSADERRDRKTGGRIFAFDALSHLSAALFDTDGTLSDIGAQIGSYIPVYGADDISEKIQRILRDNGYDPSADRTAVTDRTLWHDADITIPFGDALSVYSGDERPALFAYLGSDAHICAYGTDSDSCITVPLCRKMTGILADDITSKLRISYHTDISDEVLHREALAAVDRAAENIIKKLSFSSSASEDIEFFFGGEKKVFNLEYDRYRFENMVRDVVTELISAVDEALSTAKVSRSDLKHITVAGGAACMPCLDIFTINDIAPEYIRRDITARGCAVRADLPGAENTVSYDIGVLNIPINSNMPVFTPMIKADTPSDACSFTYSSEGLRAEEKDGRKQFCVKLYSRKKGMEHVKSPFDPEGSAISYIGCVTAELPDGYDTENDRMVFNINCSGNITASCVYHRRRGAVGRLIGKLTGKDEWQTSPVRTEVK